MGKIYAVRLLNLILLILLISSCRSDDHGPVIATDTWENTYPEFGQDLRFGQIVEASDNGFIVGAGDIAFKIDKMGLIKWNTTLNGTINSIIPVTTQEFLLIGQYYDLGNEDIWFWCSLLDESGIIKWEKTFKTDQGDYGYGITAAQNGDNSYSLVGQARFDFEELEPDKDQPKLWVIDISLDGTFIKEQFLITEGFSSYYFDEVHIPEDRSGYVIAGDVQSSFSIPTFFKIDNDANLEWSYQMEPTFRSTRSIIDDDGNYLFAGSMQTQAFLIKIDQNGTLVWEKYYGEGERKHWSISVATDGNGYISAGFTNAKGAGLDDIWIFKVDNGGNMIWDKTYGNTGYDSASGILYNSDKGFTSVGYIQVGEPSNFNIWVSKMNDAGVVYN